MHNENAQKPIFNTQTSWPLEFGLLIHFLTYRLNHYKTSQQNQDTLTILILR